MIYWGKKYFHMKQERFWDFKLKQQLMSRTACAYMLIKLATHDRELPSHLARRILSISFEMERI
jgi:hypothetical protein